MQWHWIDLVIVAVIAFSVLTGLIRGFIKELLSLGIWILAIWLAFKYSSVVEGWFQAYINDQTLRVVLAFILIFLATLIVGSAINALLAIIFKSGG